MLKFDDASWHMGGEFFPAASPIEYGATHIGLMVRWCLVKGWASSSLLELAPNEVARVIAGTMSGTDFLLQHCDGKFIDDDVIEEANRFLSVYYGDGQFYLNDYSQKFEDKVYLAPESEHDFSLFSDMVNARYQEFLLSGTLKKTQNLKENVVKKPWWKFWKF